ncbi:NUDIX hydrolase domain-like protein [Gongronella butleri]|nr:NUDIX hydrolase domain-like protein [Gongronella butleri]
MSTIFEAAASGDLDYIKKNIQAVKDKNERGWTPLHFAARFGQLAVATFLRDHNAELLTLKTGDGKTPSELALFWGYDQVADALKPADTGAKQSKKADKAVGGLAGNPNHVNFFAGSPLNRYGWFRNDTAALTRLVQAKNTRFLLFSGLDPLFDDSADKTELYYASYDTVAPLIDTASWNTHGPFLIFLGIDESAKSANDGDAPEGTAYWALDVSPNDENPALVSLHQELEKKDVSFSAALPQAFQLPKDTAAILAQGRAMLDWITRNKFCPACGRRNRVEEAGHKLRCSAKDVTECMSQKGVHNFAYPRTDPVVIVCIVHPTEDKILLGRQSKWPKRMFSCIAGFVEAGENIEEAVRREALEEAGIVVGHVAYHSTQPWPFPNSLMIGCIATAATTDVKLNDKELEGARWFTRSEVLGAIKDQGVFSLPGKFAVAYQLVHAWAVDKMYTPNTAKM